MADFTSLLMDSGGDTPQRTNEKTRGGGGTPGDHVESVVGSDPPQLEPAERLRQIESADLETPGHVQLELGMTIEEFVTHLLECEDGKLEQKAFEEYTNWSKPTISRVLQDLESEGHIERIRLGREKVVFLPREVPPQHV